MKNTKIGLVNYLTFFGIPFILIIVYHSNVQYKDRTNYLLQTYIFMYYRGNGVQRMKEVEDMRSVHISV